MIVSNPYSNTISINSKSKLSLFDFFVVIDLSLVFIQCVLPFMSFLGSYEAINILLIGVLTIILFFNSSSFFFRPKNLFPLIIFFAIVIFSYLLGYSVIAHRYLSLSFLFVGYPIYNYLKTKNKTHLLKYSFIILFLIIFVMMISTYIGLLRDPYLSRNMKNSMSFSAENVKKFIGGYELIYLVSSIIPFCFLLFLHDKQFLRKIFYLLFISFAFLLVIKSGFLTAFLISVSGVLLIYIFKIIQTKSFFKFFILIATFIIVAVILWPFLLTIFPKRFSTVFVSNNIIDVFKSIFDEFLNDRVPTILSSINAFKQSSGLGIVFTQSLQYDGTNLYGFGQHSFIFDTFALFGFYLGLLVLIALLFPLVELFKKDFYCSVPLGIVFVAFLLINNATQSIALVFYFLFPLFVDSFIRNKSYVK